MNTQTHATPMVEQRNIAEALKALEHGEKVVVVMVPQTREVWSAQERAAHALTMALGERLNAKERVAKVPTIVVPPHAAKAFVGSGHRAFRRARYWSTLHHRAKVQKLDLAPVRAKVLRAIQSTTVEGITAKALKKATGLPHGSIQQTLNWLRNHELVKAQEDAK